LRPRDDMELRLFGDWTRWSAFTDQCIRAKGTPCELNADGSAPSSSTVIQDLPRHWNDGFGVRAGFSDWIRPDVELFAGIGFDSNAVPAKTLDPALMDFNKFTAALGARIQFIKNLAGELSYTHFFFLSRHTAGESELHRGFKPPSNGPDAGGDYSSWI